MSLEDVAAKVAAEVEGKAPAKAQEKPKAAPAVEAKERDEDAPSPADEARAKREADARGQGWRPQAEWEGDPEDWVSAKVFLKRGEEMKERQHLKKQVEKGDNATRELARQIQALTDTHKRDKAEQLLAKRDQAIELGDKAQVHQIDQQIGQVMQKPDSPPQEIRDWVSRHEWWGADPLATQAAVAYYGNLEAKNRDALTDNLDKTEKYIRKRFPDLFPEDVAKAAEAAQAFTERKLSQVSVPREGATKSGPKWADLPDHARKVGDDLVRRKMMTREEYLAGFYSRG